MTSRRRGGCGNPVLCRVWRRGAVLPERRVQPLIGWQGGSFISQNRELGQYARTSWNAIGLGLRAHLRKGLWSPFFQVGAHRFAISVRDQNGKPPHGTPSSIGVVGLSWAAGVRLLITEGVTFSLLYQRFRPQTNLLDGLPGPRKDRIEAIMGELLFYFPEGETEMLKAVSNEHARSEWYL